MSMLFVLRASASGLVYGYTVTDNQVPGDENSEYIAWNEFPCEPPFASMEDAELRVGDYVGLILSDDGVLSPAPPPAPEYVPIMTVLMFRDRFTLAEKSSIYTIAETDVVMRVIVDDLNTAEFVSVDDQHTIDGVDYMISVNAIDPSRREALLAPALRDNSGLAPS
jgi:hypothetical protein